MEPMLLLWGYWASREWDSALASFVVVESIVEERDEVVESIVVD